MTAAPPSLEPMTHTRSCPALVPGDDNCTCGLRWRVALATEQEMHAAWRKRAEEAETALAMRRADGRLREALLAIRGCTRPGDRTVDELVRALDMVNDMANSALRGEP